MPSPIPESSNGFLAGAWTPIDALLFLKTASKDFWDTDAEPGSEGEPVEMLSGVALKGTLPLFGISGGNGGGGRREGRLSDAAPGVNVCGCERGCERSGFLYG